MPDPLPPFGLTGDARWRFDGSALLLLCGLQADPWQADVLRADDKRLLILCTRQGGKSTVVVVKALHRAMTSPAGFPRTIILLSKSQRQSGELFHKLLTMYARLGRPVAAESENKLSLTLENGSRILSLPSTPDTLVGYSSIDTLIIDEAALVDDALYHMVRPFLAVGGGRLIMMTTPRGKTGFFYRAWVGAEKWTRIRKTADDCPRIPREFLEEERISKGESLFQQEYYCSFEMSEGMVYPEFPSAITGDLPAPPCLAYLGVDPGFAGAYAQLLGLLDAGGVLWIVQEDYHRGRTTEEAVATAIEMNEANGLDRAWIDAAEPRTVETYRRNGIPAVPAYKAIVAGIAAVAQRLRTGRLKVHRSCVDLIAEANTYRYPTEEEKKIVGENPIKGADHALDALRYMVSGIDRVRELRPRPIEEYAEPLRTPPPGHPDGDYTRPMPSRPAPRPTRVETEEDKAAQREYLQNHAWE